MSTLAMGAIKRVLPFMPHSLPATAAAETVIPDPLESLFCRPQRRAFGRIGFSEKRPQRQGVVALLAKARGQNPAVANPTDRQKLRRRDNPGKRITAPPEPPIRVGAEVEGVIEQEDTLQLGWRL
jgi:hypothetical protein